MHEYDVQKLYKRRKEHLLMNMFAQKGNVDFVATIKPDMLLTITMEPSSKRVYGQFSIETIHERRKRNREFSGFFFPVLLIRIGKQNVKIIEK